jgi:centromere/kinetochore protein ZW10
VQLLNTELAFNEGVTNVLEEVQKFSEHISKGHDAVQRDQINEALLCLQAAENFMNKSPLSRYENVASLVKRTHLTLRDAIAALLKSRWADQIQLSKDGLKFCTRGETGQILFHPTR